MALATLGPPRGGPLCLTLETAQRMMEESSRSPILISGQRERRRNQLPKLGLRATLRSRVFLGVVLFVFSVGLPPFDDLSEVDLATHMLQHVLIVFAGVLVAYPLFRRRGEGSGGLVPWVSLLASSGLIVFWHLPVPWDTAVLNPAVHVLEHLSFLGVGVLLGSWIRLLSDSAKIGALLAAFFGHMVYAVLLVSPWSGQVYSLYSVPDQAILGWALLLTGPSLLIGVAYVIARNPSWLGGFSGSPATAERRQTFIDRVKVPRWAVPGLSLLLMVGLLGYFGMAAVALAGQHPSPTMGGATVYIQETPVSWQYSPPQLRVVLGVNNTVTWVSHSISYDTVTSTTGAFDSGPIPPGQRYTFTFQSPGTYEYYCAYHPWMQGTVVVLSG